uniref:DNA/RNA-binding domain-containing protein n=1 Tax=Clastoptera arizonana TaxID=38151 RepID=A0A1B6BZA1_9HEMI
MGLNAAVQALKKAERLKEKVVNSQDLLNDNEARLCQQQLQDIYQQVLILDLEYALDKKVEQELWSHGFKKYIATLQSLAKDKKNPKRSESQALLSASLDGASGFYLTLLQEVCTTFDLDLPFRRKDLTYGSCKRTDLLTKPHKNSCYYICQHCLVHLGDIARYRNRSRQAESFYRHAVKLSPTSGQPYNQLALLEASRGDKLSTVFHYLRSIAVRHMFPAAASNLALTFEKCANQPLNKDIHSTKLTSYEYLSLFLKLHAYFHTCTKLNVCEAYVKLLTDTLTPHIATQSFNSWKLVQMFAINVYAYFHPCKDSESSDLLTEDEKQVRSFIIDLIAGFLNAFLLPVYTLKQDETILDYFALPVIKLTLDWIRLNQEVLCEDGFNKRLQIWPGLCRLLNVLQGILENFNHDPYEKYPLPEDSDLQGFLPLENSFSELNFDEQDLTVGVRQKLRGARLIQLGTWLSTLPYHLITIRYTGSSVTFEPVSGVQVLPSSELIKELEELSLNKVFSPSPAPSDTASSRASNNTPEHISVVELIPTLENVQEKRAGILKPQTTNEKGMNGVKTGRVRQNVAMQAILRRSQEQETKQVTFKTPSPPISPKIEPPLPPVNWRNPLPVPSFPPPAFPFPPPPLENINFHNGPAGPRSFNSGLWPEEPRQKWLTSDDRSSQPLTRNMPYQMNQKPPPLPTSDLFNNWKSGVNLKLGPFSPPIFSQPPPFTPSRTEAPNQLIDQMQQQHQHLPAQQNNNVMSPAYSLFSPAWATQHHPHQFMGTSLLGPQSLWSGPGPSPLERLLEQQKQLREAPMPQTDNT